MPSANANPAAQINFIFRQLPDDVLDQIGAHRGGAYHQDAEASGVPPESVIAAVGGAAVAAGQDTLTIGFVQNVGNGPRRLFDNSGRREIRSIGASSRGGRSGCRRKHVSDCVRRRLHYRRRD